MVFNLIRQTCNGFTYQVVWKGNLAASTPVTWQSTLIFIMRVDEVIRHTAEGKTRGMRAVLKSASNWLVKRNMS